MLHHMNRAVSGNTDKNFENVVLLLHGDGTNGAQNNTFLDSSTNNYTITRNGNTTQGSYNPYGASWSNYFDGTGDFLTFSTRTLNGDFCGECWFYKTANPASASCIFGGADPAVTNSNTQFVIENTGAVTLVLVGVIVINAVGTAALINQWNHIAWVRSGTGTNNCAIFVNGVRQGQGTSTSNVSTFDRIGCIGATKLSIGYISNARMVIGSSVYDPSQSTITVPTAPLTAITNTQLLTCQSNGFRDNSSNNLTITRNGDVSVQSFSPVTLTLPYSTSQNGGSGYFDGNGDYLDVGSTSYNMAGNWTIEMWFYTSSASGMLFDARPNSTNGLYPALIISSSTSLNFYYSAADHIFTTPNLLNSWFHVAIVKNSTTITIFLNGTSVYTVSDTNTWTIAASRPRLGANGAFFGVAPLPVTGYLSNVRIVNGTAVYTSSFTPPAGPLTAITNTQLLCNFTNGAIFDNSMMNVLETISSTQISTTSPKFGTGSILFNGTTDYLTSPFGRNFTFGTGDFTIEFWVRFTGTTGRQDILWINVGASDRLGIIYNISANNITYYISPTVGNAINAPFTPTAGTWYHIALTRASGFSKLFINGTQGGSTYTDSRNYSTAYQLFMGRDSSAASSYLNGRVDDVRITRGIARYTANFTPSQQPFPNR